MRYRAGGLDALFDPGDAEAWRGVPVTVDGRRVGTVTDATIVDGRLDLGFELDDPAMETLLSADPPMGVYTNE